MGVGLDDTFIITSEYFRTDTQKTPAERVATAISTVGISIFATTFTTAFAFILGLVSKIPGVYWLCLYAFPIFIINFIYHITFFIALLVLDEKRIEANREDLWRCFIVRDNAGDSEEIFQTNSASTTEGSEEDGHDISAQKKTIPDRIMIWYSEQLLRPWVKFAVIVIFGGWFILCSYRITLLEQRFDPTDLVPKDSYTKHYLDSLNKYNSLSISMTAVFRDVDQSDPIIQEQMISYIDDLVDLKEFGTQPTFCWVRDFKKLKNDTRVAPFLSGKTFNEQIDFLMNIPAINDIYGKDIIRDENGDIIASKCLLFTRGVMYGDAVALIGLLRNQRKVAAAQPINQGLKDWSFFGYNYMFLIFEFLSIHMEELRTTAIAGILAVSVISFFLMPHWTAIVFVFPLMMILYVDLLGKIYLRGKRPPPQKKKKYKQYVILHSSLTSCHTNVF